MFGMESVIVAVNKIMFLLDSCRPCSISRAFLMIKECPVILLNCISIFLIVKDAHKQIFLIRKIVLRDLTSYKGIFTLTGVVSLF